MHHKPNRHSLHTLYSKTYKPQETTIVQNKYTFQAWLSISFSYYRTPQSTLTKIKLLTKQPHKARLIIQTTKTMFFFCLLYAIRLYINIHFHLLHYISHIFKLICFFFFLRCYNIINIYIISVPNTFKCNNHAESTK